MLLSLTFAAFVVNAIWAQQVGNNTAETHPSLSWKQCTGQGSCTSKSASVTLDSNWRWLHTTSGYTNCYTGNTWNTTLCPDDATCAKNCALEGGDYSGTYVRSRVYLMASEAQYQGFNLLNKEFTLDVDVSKLPCGLNGAVYFSEMPLDGGKSSTNAAGAKYGTGYCDSQCPHDIKFIDGAANSDGWTASPNDTNAGTGKYGACCAEMDIWEANSISAAYTPHPCTVTGYHKCEGTECGDGDNRYGGVCDKDGCDFNSYRQGDKTFYGPGFSGIDTNKKFTIVTQFLTDSNSTSGTLKEIRRIYVQNGKVIQNSKNNISGMDAYDSITSDYCDAQKAAFGDHTSFQDHGGLKAMGSALGRGMVLVLSVWDDHAVNMLWLDSTYPTDADPSKPGIARGTCSTSSGKPTDVESSAADATVTYSNIRFGDIGSTYTGNAASSSSGGTTTTTSSGGGGGTCSTLWGQCGGQGYSGPTCCQQGSCKVLNQWYSQCVS
ncbi:glycoside hydrolase [Auriculariales sp. MPI-PUGE-AT-0066]|nr:glycoside hydrolase [Auriculariales sp. MPI-PUGE-AT-0066]